MSSTAGETNVIDALPFLKTSDDAVWDRAKRTRDSYYEAIDARLKAAKVQALLRKSGDHVFPPWLHMEAWVAPPRRLNRPDSGQVRAGLVITVDAKPYHEEQIVTSAELMHGNRRIAVSEKKDFRAANAAEWAMYALGQGPKPSNYHPVSDAIIGMLIGFIPFVENPNVNKIRKPFRPSIWKSGLPAVLGLGGLILAGYGALRIINLDRYYEAPGPYVLLILLGAALMLAAMALGRRRINVISVANAPRTPPRDLGMVDSWHTLVPGLGDRFEAAKQRVFAKLLDSDVIGAKSFVEAYNFRTPMHFEERERVVLIKGQSVLHVHFYKFGSDLFVGWDAYLNWARWSDNVVVSKRVEKGCAIEFREVRQGLYIPNQFDLIDLNSMSEFVHKRLEVEIRALMKEFNIDQEIDFAIIRGDRESALDSAKHGTREKKGRGWSSRKEFARVGPE